MNKYKNEFFEELNYENSCIEQLFYRILPDKREEKWSEQRSKYGGFDERSTWSLNWFMTEHIYIWLKLYLKFADQVVDLEFNKFTINGEEKTQRDWIIQAINDIEYYFKFNDSVDDKDIESENKAKNAYIIIGNILPALWW